MKNIKCYLSKRCNVAVSWYNIFIDRNKLAHHKASIQNIASLDWSKIQDPNSITLLDAQNANQSLVTCLKALKRVDQSIDISWLSS